MTSLLPRNFFNVDDKLLNSSILLKEWDINTNYYSHLFKKYEELYRKETGIKENLKNSNLENKELQKKQILNQPIKKSSLNQSISDKKYKTK